MTHHAYVYEGTRLHLQSLVDDAKKRFDFALADPDVHIFDVERFGIDDARNVRQEASLKSTYGRSLFILSMSSITHEAQQALLKLSEEPQDGLLLIVLLPHGLLIPTLRSRFLPYAWPITAASSLESEAIQFLQSSYKERSAIIASIIDTGERDRARAFLEALSAILYKRMTDKEMRDGLRDIELVRSYLTDRSPSIKMLLEHVAVTLPQTV